MPRLLRPLSALLLGAVICAPVADAAPPPKAKPAASARPAPANPQDAQTVSLSPEGDVTQGSPRAKVMLVEYGSPTCPFCKQWHDQIYVQVKRDYVDTGKIRFAFRELPSHNPPVDAAIFGIARCAAREKYFPVLDEAYLRQGEIERASASPQGPGQAIVSLAINAGVADDRLGDCLDDPALTARLDAVRQLAVRDHVEGTPTLVLDGVTLQDGYDDYDTLRALIDKAIAAAR